MFSVYALYSKTYNKIYIGQTEDLDRRLFEHNNGLLSRYTKKFKLWEVIYTEEYSSTREALLREKQLKSQEGREFIWKIVKKGCRFDPLANVRQLTDARGAFQDLRLFYCHKSFCLYSPCEVLIFLKQSNSSSLFNIK